LAGSLSLWTNWSTSGAIPSMRAWVCPAEIETGSTDITLSVPDDANLRAAFRGALLLLADPANWEQMADATPEQCAEVFMELFEQFLSSE